MSTGAITGYIDVAQLTLYGFWIFFAGLVYYLQREGKREGYPLETTSKPGKKLEGWPPLPSPKTFKLAHGGTASFPNNFQSPQQLKAVSTAPWSGAPIVPTGDPMLDGVGPGAYADRADVPDQTYEGEPKIVPLRAAPGFSVAHQDNDPRGLPVVGADGRTGGTVSEVWVDRSEMIIRYLEVTVPVAGGTRQVLLPFTFSRVTQRQVKVASVYGHHFAKVPGTRNPDTVTLLEEDKICAFYGGGTLYADPSRGEPLI